MATASIVVDEGPRVEEIRSVAMAAGFSRARILAPFNVDNDVVSPEIPPGYVLSAPALLVVALPYGNDDPGERNPPVDNESAALPFYKARARVAAFARRNYYGETVARLKGVAAEFRRRFGGTKADYRIFCNSFIPEKPLAAACGLGAIGRNSLLITPEAGSLVIIGALSLPFPIECDAPLPGASDNRFPLCGDCRACAVACPTGALSGDGTLDRSRCIQWFASGHGTPPKEVAAAWENRLYGCSNCQDACPHNKKPIHGVATERGALPDAMDAAELSALSDERIKNLFRGTAMGMSWLGPAAIRRNAILASRGHDSDGWRDKDAVPTRRS